MLFRQLFDEATWTYTYLLAEHEGGQALLIDPVREKVPQYQQLIRELKLQLIYAIDTHVHADHITALGKLRELYGCETIFGERTQAQCASHMVKEGEIISLGNLHLKTIYTPGHTDDSYCFLLTNETPQLLFTGDTLLIRGTGRTDFQQGDARQQYESLFNKLLKLPDSTLVYPGHDYKGMTVSTIGEEKRFNPRLQVSNAKEYCEIMDNLNLPNPKLMDVAVPANLGCGL
ncbi:MBL fold metallo-hydrolase [Endozoicomonas sp. SM1973]|uniref:MBL fold metallo-hydrolase n=1 Tax=Spartinivicinus marinus TaxID=2994442 RepID=A0A853IGL7_9GAMM|nr:MBL fold metallo-hydrolase [Spartinivicinus marinus]MCX4028384.1 MBL fold metallo-hydrolase [Spartinivicinus marinus]NYZ68617.1 MBL fold metallo-hydrolase [Spartinivicinus marinus]